MQFGVAGETRFRLAVGNDSCRFVALVHFDAMRIELVLLERDRLSQCLPLRFTSLARIATRIHARFDLLDVCTACHTERFEDRTKLTNGLVRAGHNLFGDWSALGRIGVE